MVTKSRTVHVRDVLAAGTVCVPFLVLMATWVLWANRLPANVTLRNDLSSLNAAVLPMWLIAVGLGIVLLGVSVAAVTLVPEGPNDAQSRRVPLFWCGAVAGAACTIWISQSWVAMSPGLSNPSRFNAIAGFATIASGLYGLLPLFIARRPSRGPHDAEQTAEGQPSESAS